MVFQSAGFSPKMRHNGAGMTGTYTVGSTTNSAGMITVLESGGFHISTGGGVLGQLNAAGQSYTAVVMRDTTPTNKYLRVGSYTGSGTHGVNFTVSPLSPRKITANTFTAAYV